MNDKKTYTPISNENFLRLLRFYKIPESAEDEVLYNLYIETVELLTLHHHTFENIPYINLDHQRLILQLIHDYDFRMRGLNFEERRSLLKDELFHNKLINVVVDKYGSSAIFKYDSGTYLTPFSMEISTINVYLNFIMLKLGSIPRHNKATELYAELLTSAFSYVLTITELLVRGFEKEALATWRSLHELEATLLLIQDEKVLAQYNQHILYALAFNKLIAQAESDKVFIEIKAKMKDLKLKSKDTKRFIEYGWLLAHNDFDLNIHKFNFRDGVQTLAGLNHKRNIYQVASEVTHSSPLTLFTKRHYFLSIALENLYSSFLTIEALFAAFYIKNTTKNEAEFYEVTRSIYLEDINFVKDRITK